MTQYTDTDGVDGPFKRAMERAMREDAKAKRRKPDVLVVNGGSVFRFTPQTVKAARWLKRNVSDGAWLDGSLMCEHRYAQGLIDGLKEAGFSGRVGWPK